jgi:hypothetical protein
MRPAATPNDRSAAQIRRLSAWPTSEDSVTSRDEGCGQAGRKANVPRAALDRLQPPGSAPVRMIFVTLA